MKTLVLMNNFPKNLALRENAREIFSLILKENYTILNFKNIEFINRAFANELMKLEKRNNLNISKENMNEQIQIMFKHALEDSPKRSSNSGFRVGDVKELLSSL